MLTLLALITGTLLVLRAVIVFTAEVALAAKRNGRN